MTAAAAIRRVVAAGPGVDRGERHPLGHRLPVRARPDLDLLAVGHPDRLGAGRGGAPPVALGVDRVDPRPRPEQPGGEPAAQLDDLRCRPGPGHRDELERVGARGLPCAARVGGGARRREALVLHLRRRRGRGREPGGLDVLGLARRWRHADRRGGRRRHPRRHQHRRERSHEPRTHPTPCSPRPTAHDPPDRSSTGRTRRGFGRYGARPRCRGPVAGSATWPSPHPSTSPSPARGRTTCATSPSRVPKRAITAFVGVSGSGKSSLVFDTIAAEAQRQLNETFSAFVRGFLPKLGQPDADLIENLSTAIVVDQQPPRRRLPLDAGHGHRHQPAAAAAVVPPQQPARRRTASRSRSTTAGHVPGRATASAGRSQLDHALFFDRRSRSTRARSCTATSPSTAGTGTSTPSPGRSTTTSRWRDYTDAEWQLLLYGADEKIAIAGPGPQDDEHGLRGRRDQVQPALHPRRRGRRSERKKETVARFTTSVRCPDCAGTRLAEAPRTATVGGRTLPEVCALDLGDAARAAARRCRDAAVGAAGRRGRRAGRRARRHGAGLPHAGPGDLHAVGRGVAADQDGPPPRVVAGRRHVRVRRADDRAAPARRRPDERAAAPAARQGQHRARRRARHRRDHRRRPRRRARPAGGHRRRADRLRGRRRRASRTPARSPGSSCTARCACEDEPPHAHRARCR